MGLRWHRYRLVFPSRSSFVLFNLLNKSIIRISTRYADHARLRGDFRAFSDDSLNTALKRLNFLVAANLTDADLISRWYNNLSQTSQAMDLLVLLTNQCNFACCYCPQEADADFRRVTSRAWKRIIPWLEGAIKSRRPRHVRVAFFGGEPLAEFTLLCLATGFKLKFWERLCLGVEPGSPGPPPASRPTGTIAAG